MLLTLCCQVPPFGPSVGSTAVKTCHRKVCRRQTLYTPDFAQFIKNFRGIVAVKCRGSMRSASFCSILSDVKIQLPFQATLPALSNMLTWQVYKVPSLPSFINPLHHLTYYLLKSHNTRTSLVSSICISQLSSHSSLPLRLLPLQPCRKPRPEQWDNVVMTTIILNTTVLLMAW